MIGNDNFHFKQKIVKKSEEFSMLSGSWSTNRRNYILEHFVYGNSYRINKIYMFMFDVYVRYTMLIIIMSKTV